MSFITTRRSVILLALSASLGLAACGGGGGNSGTPSINDPNGWNAVTALKVTDTTVGTGATAETGKTATVTYTGYLYDGRVSDTRGTRFESGSFSFKLGANAVIQGFEAGVLGMKVGGKRTLTIPASQAYGSAGYGAIPPNAALVFDIELTGIN